METGVIIQEPIFTKTNVEEAPAGVGLDHSSMDVKKVNNIIPGEAEEVVNGSGNKETEEPEHEKEEAMTTVSVVEEEGKIVKEKAIETEEDEQSFTFVHEPESFNKTIEDSEKILSDVSLEKAKEDDITPKPEEVSVEKPVKQVDDDSRTAETSVNGTEAEHKDTVSVEETAPEEETATNGESLHDVETTKRVLLEAEKDQTEIVKTVIEDHGIVNNEETKVHESESSKENVNSVEEVKNSDDAEKFSREVNVDRGKEEDITPKQEEVQESLTVIETPTIQEEDIVSKASKESEEKEHVLVRDLPQDETLVTVDTSTVQESAMLKSLETRIDETVAEPTQDLNLVKEQEEAETVKTVKSSDEVQESIMVDKISKETEEDEHVLVTNMPQGEIFVTEAETLEAKEDTEPNVYLNKEQEGTEKIEESPSDLALKLDKEEVKDANINADEEYGGQIMEEQRGLDSKEPEAEQTDRNRNDETEENMVSHPVIESVKEIEKPSLEPPSEVSEETSKTIDDNIEENLKEEVTPHQEGQEEGSYGLETKEETVVEERSVVDLTPLQQESCLKNEQEEETKFEKEQTEKHEPANDEVADDQKTLLEEKSDEVIQVSSASLQEGETIAEAEKIQDIKANEEEQDIALKVDKEELKDDKMNEPEVDKIDQNRTGETEEILVEKLVSPPVEDMEKPSLESFSEASEETVKTIDEKTEEKPEGEEATPHQEGQEKSFNGLETKEEKVSVPESIELGDIVLEERSVVDLTPLQQESCLKNEQEKEMKFEKEQIEKHGEVESDEVTEDSRTAEIEQNAPVSAEEISENTVNETAPEDDHQGKNAEPVEAIKESDDAEIISHDVAGDREKEDDTTRKAEEVQESPEVIETPTIQGDKFESEASTDVQEQEHVLVRDMPQIETIVPEAEAASTSPAQEAEILKTQKATNNETEAGQVTKEDTEPSLDMKEDQETEETETVKPVMSSDEVRLSDQVEVPAEQSVEVKSKETVQDESREEKHENLVDVPFEESEKYQDNEPETTLASKKFEEMPSDLTLKVDKEEIKDDQFYETQIMEEQRGLDSNEPEAEQIDQNRTDETEDTPVENLVTVEGESTHSQTLLDAESVAKVEKPYLEPPSELSEETSETVDEKIEEKPEEEEVTQHQEGQEKGSSGLETKDETVSVPESSELGEKPHEKESCLPNEEDKETKLQEEQIETHEPTMAEVSYDRPVEEKSDKVIQVSSASPSEEREDDTFVEDKKVDEEEKVADKIQKSLETAETVEPHSSLPSSSEEKEHETVSEKIEEEKVEEEQKTEDEATKSHERQEELSKTEATTVETRDIGSSSLSEKDSLDQTHAEVQVKDDETLTAEAMKGDGERTVRDMMPQSETIVTEAEPVKETSAVQESPILTILETKNDETEAVHSPIGGEEEIQLAKEHTGPIMEVKEDKEEEVTETIKSVIVSDEVRSSDVQAEESGEHTEHCSSEIKNESQGRDESVDVKPKEIIQEETTQDKDDNLLDVTSGESALGSASEVSEETSKTVDEKIEEKPQEEVIPHQEGQEEEKEPKLAKEKTKKHESASEEDANAQQTPAAEKSDEVIQVSSASPSEEKEIETVVEAEKIEDKANEEDQAADKIQRSLETFETVEPHISFPSPPEEHSTVAEGVKVKETEPVGDISEKGLDVSETKDLSLPLESSRSDETESSELVAEAEEQKPKQVKEILEGEIKEVDEIKADTIPKETHSDVAQEEQARDLHVEQEVVSSAEKEETKAKEPEDEHVDSSEKNDDETLIAETKKEDEDITVGLDGLGTSTTAENVCSKQEEEFENVEDPKLEESKDDKSQEVSETIEAVEATEDHTLVTETSEAHQTPSFLSELEDQIPNQIEEIHEEETEEAHKSQVVDDQNSKQVEEIHEKSETKEAHSVEATSDQNLPDETSQTDKTPEQIEEIHEEETKEAHKLQEEEEVLPTENVPREAPVSMLASGEGNSAGDAQEEQHVSAETEESVGDTKPKESEEEITEKSNDQIETSTKATKVEDEDTKKPDSEVAEVTEEQSLPHAPENAPLKQEESKDLGTPHKDVVKEEKSPLRNDNPEYLTEEAEHGDENISTLPVVDILKGLQATLQEEREINDSESTEGNMVTEPSEQEQKTGDAEVEPETVEKNLSTDISEPVPEEKQDEKVVEEYPASEIKEASTLQQDASGETEKIQEVNDLEKKSLLEEEVKLQEEHKEEGNVQEIISREFEVNVEEKSQEETREIADQSLTEVVPGEKILIPSSDFPTEESEHVVSGEKQEEVSAQKGANASITEPEQISLQEEKKAETHETVKEDQSFDIKEEKKTEKLEGLSVTRDDKETFGSEVKKDKEDAINEVTTSEKQITEPPSEAEKESNEEHVESQAISDDTKNNTDRDFPTEEIPKEQREEVNADKSLTNEVLDEQELIQSPKKVEEEEKNEKTVEALITSENVLVQDQSKDFEQDKKSNDLTYVQGENVTNDSALAQKEETSLTEEKREVDNVKTEIKHGVSTEEKNNESEKIDQEESKQTDHIKEEIKEEDQKETTTQEAQECLNNIKNIDNATERTKSESSREIENLSSVSNTQEKSKKEDEVPKLETLKIAEELQPQPKDGEAENKQESEPTVNEPARKSQSDQVKGTNKSEDAATKPHIEEEAKTEEEDEDGDEHKDDKTSPDSIVMVEAKDTVNITKTQHKKSQGILSQVKHSISKVKKALTGKSSHTTKPSSPK
ncbi:unnamed protein product [Microthlaspi erraticum]|uniref:Uncharacterized protein n=1 Tax=Microthlaspi erraticum TaxID=1685480 RepID=A0A6D2KSA6_9BRAS|nr:unnamed protein product [Microthlaspi erraticum]